MEEASTSDYWKGHPRFTSTGTIDVPVFYPTIHEMRDFPTFIDKIEQMHHAHLICGIVKIVPPPEYHARKSNDYSDVDNYIIEQPVKEKIEGSGGIYTKTNRLFRKSISVRDFRVLCDKMRLPKEGLSPEEVEKYYWKTILQGEPVYGADTPGSICDPDLKEFNMNHLNTVLDLLDNFEIKIKGVNTVYLYFGMWKTTFPWHTEDMDLYSINYLHYGEPKFWYAIATESNSRFERLAAQTFPSAAKNCKSFLRHKTFMISPHVLKRYNIKFGTMVQYPNEFIITFPRGYHMGFNMGYNCAESTNFASDRWVDFGKNALVCTCRADNVEIDMRPSMKQFRPDEYNKKMVRKLCLGKNALVCTCRTDSVEIDMRPFMKQFRPDEYDGWFKYWYGERIVKEKKKVSASKRQPIHNDSAVEKKRRRINQMSKGTRGPYIEISQDSGSDSNEDENTRFMNSKSMADLISNDQWKKKVRLLWSNLPIDFNAEREFNNCRASESPHCSVCQYFVPKPLLIKRDRIPASSVRLIRRAWYAKVDPDQCDIDDNAIEDRLLRCSNCYVVVHFGCYPVGNVPADINEWKCARCCRRDDLMIRFASCHLCELRGGALIPAMNSSGDFVHVICALLNRRTIFVDPIRLDLAYTRPFKKLRASVLFENRPSAEYLNASDLNSDLGKFECEYCLNSREGLLKCVLCDDVLFHATCGRLAGVSYEFRNWPDLTVAVCPDHNEVVDNAPPLIVGDKVRVAVDGSRKMVKGMVLNIEYHDCCTISFMDRNWSDDVIPSDIVECECDRIGCGGFHVPGAKIRLKWDDGLIYDGVFRNRYKRATYIIQLAANFSKLPKIIKVGRDAIFARGEKPVNLDGT